MFADLTTTLSDFMDHPGNVFGEVLSIALLAAVALILLHFVLALIGGRTQRPRRPLNWWERLLYMATVLTVAVLAVTSFYCTLRFGQMRGWWLFAHMCGAGALTAALPLLAITWAGTCRFGREAAGNDQETFAPHFFWMPKLLFWLFLVGGLGVVLTTLLSMLPLFGTDGMHVLLDLHRYAGLLAVVVLLMHVYCVLLQRVRLR